MTITDERAQPFRIDGGRTAVLLVHGFSGSPASMRPWGEALAEHGYTVVCPLLPGHGTSWRDLAKTSWQDWYGAVRDTFDALIVEFDRVFVAALSMGGALSLRLAQERGDAVAGLMLVNPSVCRPQRIDAAILSQVDRARLLGLVTAVVPSLAGITNDIKKPGQDEAGYDRTSIAGAGQVIKLQDVVRKDLHLVGQPLVVFTSPEDHVVEPISSETVLRDVSSSRRTMVRLNNSYHVATLDNDAPLIFSESIDFIGRVEATDG